MIVECQIFHASLFAVATPEEGEAERNLLTGIYPATDLFLY